MSGVDTRAALTDRQRELLEFIRRYRAEHGISPSLQEIADFGDMSRPCSHEHITSLERKGYVRRYPGVPRSVVPIDHEGKGTPQ